MENKSPRFYQFIAKRTRPGGFRREIINLETRNLHDFCSPLPEVETIDLFRVNFFYARFVLFRIFVTLRTVL